MERQHNYIYRITRDDGFFYIGMHSTDNILDGYFGGGTRLRNSVSKHGKHAHKMEVLEFYDTRQELVARERELICEELLSNPLCLNLKIGGEGGGILAEKNKTNGFHRKGYDAMFAARDHSLASKKANATRKANGGEYNTVGAFLAALSEGAREKRKQTFAARGHAQGEKNSQFGTKWVHKDGSELKVKSTEIAAYLLSGYQTGRAPRSM